MTSIKKSSSGAEEEVAFQATFGEGLGVLAQRLIGCGHSLSAATIARLKNPVLLGELRVYRDDPQKVILGLVGSAETLWAKFSTEYQKAFLTAFVSKWGSDNICMVIGGNSGSGVTHVTTQWVKENFPTIRLISMIPVVNKATGLAICGMGVALYEPHDDGELDSRPQRYSYMSAEGVVRIHEDAHNKLIYNPRPAAPAKDASQETVTAHWEHSFVTAGDGALLTEPMAGAWVNHTIWPLNIEGGGAGRQQIMAFMIHFLNGELSVLEGGPGTRNELRAFAEKTPFNSNPTISSCVNSTYLLSLIQNELTAKDKEIAALTKKLKVATKTQKGEHYRSVEESDAAYREYCVSSTEAARKFTINWSSSSPPNEYVWEKNCQHSAIPRFAGYKKLSGDGPQFVKIGPGSQVYGCFEGGAGRNFYGSHDLVIGML